MTKMSTKASTIWQILANFSLCECITKWIRNEWTKNEWSKLKRPKQEQLIQNWVNKPNSHWMPSNIIMNAKNSNTSSYWAMLVNSVPARENTNKEYHVHRILANHEPVKSTHHKTVTQPTKLWHLPIKRRRLPNKINHKIMSAVRWHSCVALQFDSHLVSKVWNNGNFDSFQQITNFKNTASINGTSAIRKCTKQIW